MCQGIQAGDRIKRQCQICIGPRSQHRERGNRCHQQECFAANIRAPDFHRPAPEQKGGKQAPGQVHDLGEALASQSKRPEVQVLCQVGEPEVRDVYAAQTAVVQDPGRLLQMIQQSVEGLELGSESQCECQSEEQTEAELRQEVVLADGKIPECGKGFKVYK